MRTKSRLTITLPKDILNKIDQNIDGSIIRNRSHAIESLIRQSLKTPIQTAVILTGGDKHAINPALKAVDGKPLIHILMNQIISVGISKVVVCTGLDSAKIKEELGTGKQLGIEIKYVIESKPTGTGGAIKKAQKFISEEDFLVIHGDILNRVNLEIFANFHLQEGTVATIVVMPKKGEKSLGKVLIEGNQIKQFYEKTETQGIDIINTGIYLFKKSIFDKLNSKFCKLEKDIFPKLAKENQLTAFIYQGFWFDISTSKQFNLAKNTWIKTK